MMDLMSQTSEAVVEFGPGEDGVRAPGRRLRVRGFVAGLAADRRLVPLAAVLGGAALFGSLVSEWQTSVVDNAAFWGDGEVGTRTLVTRVAELGSWGSGYLIGLFLLVAAATITLFGPPAGRRYGRLIALSVGGVLLGLLAALASYLGDTSLILGEYGASGLEEGQLTLSAGRGVWCAAVGVALVMLAMYLAGRRLTEQAETDPAPVWSWKRPPAAEDEGPPDAPFDLTVSSARPFTASNDNRDKPGGGISE